jgi:hypothetical protein
VRYLPAGSGSSSSGRVLRQMLHRPLDNSQVGSNVLVISSYDAASGELLMRAKQRCTFVRAGMKVRFVCKWFEVCQSTVLCVHSCLPSPASLSPNCSVLLNGPGMNSCSCRCWRAALHYAVCAVPCQWVLAARVLTVFPFHNDLVAAAAAAGGGPLHVVQRL